MIEELQSPKQFDSIEGIPEPSANPSLFGHEAIETVLTDTLNKGRMHHALLMEGPLGIGKATFAFHLAGHILASSEMSETSSRFYKPDYKKPLWRQIATGTHPAVLHIGRPFDQKSGKFKTAITVEEIRKITHFMSRTAHDSGWRIVIIDPADDMNRNAANALLKTLEEPPAKALFLLISHAAGRLLPTIRSRCQTIQFQPLDTDDVSKALSALSEQSGMSFDGQYDRGVLLEKAEGSVRKALMMTVFGGLEIAQTAEEIIYSERFDLTKAQMLAQSISAREAETQYDLFTDHILNIIAGTAQSRAIAGDLADALAWSQLYEKTNTDIVNTDSYNLDRRQAAILLLDKIHKANRHGINSIA